MRSPSRQVTRMEKLQTAIRFFDEKLEQLEMLIGEEREKGGKPTPEKPQSTWLLATCGASRRLRRSTPT